MTDARPSLRKLSLWDSWADNTVSIIPNSGIQIIDLGFNINVNIAFSAHFHEEKTQEGRHSLNEVDDTSDEYEALSDKNEILYTVDRKRAVGFFTDNWIPVPFFRMSEGSNSSQTHAFGPTTWVRMRVTEIDKDVSIPESDVPYMHTHRVQLAFDTSVSSDNSALSKYLTPDSVDALNKREFSLVTDFRAVSNFVGPVGSDENPQSWVSDWVKEIYDVRAKVLKRRPLFEGEEEGEGSILEPWANYIALLKAIDMMVNTPKIRLERVLGQEEALLPVDVDLILDIGNSRTVGLLSESTENDDGQSLGNLTPLELRDLGKPELFYSGLISSRVEFSDESFGPEIYAMRAGNTNAFVWPSFVRVGPEAMRLVQRHQGNEPMSGLSSPKRYLWDNSVLKQDWEIHNRKNMGQLPKTLRAAMKSLNSNGDVIEQVKVEEKQKIRERMGPEVRDMAIKPRFSKSSAYGFMIAEIISHALVQINDPAYRFSQTNKEAPRRLNKIILTLPTATPSQEQAIVRSRAEGALKLVWKRLSDSGQTNSSTKIPKIIADWDEASCTQLVYLYSEIVHKYAGDIDKYLQTFGSTRSANDGDVQGRQSLRVACIDIGGGTTDVMVSTYFKDTHTSLIPKQDYREGFRKAGDDIILRVISDLVLPRIKEDLIKNGLDADKSSQIMQKLFFANAAGVTEPQKHLKRQFASRVLTPIAVAILEECELDREEVIELNTGKILSQGDKIALPKKLLDYFNQNVALSIKGWTIANIDLQFYIHEVDAIIEQQFAQNFNNLSEVINHFKADIVLLTGRPSKLPKIRSMILNSCAVTPNRIISMHKYRPGAWYPFLDSFGYIGDPKYTVVVGAMLISRCSNSITGFQIPETAFRMKSTIKYVGQMKPSGQIVDSDILFEINQIEENEVPSKEISMGSPIHIGSRQFSFEDWPTDPLYRLSFKVGTTPNTPFKVTIGQRQTGSSDDETPHLVKEAIKEAFEVIEVVDRDGNSLPQRKSIDFKMQTLVNNEYWLETGTFPSSV